MSDADADTDRASDRAGREYGRAVFAAVCVCAVVLAAALAPALAAGSGAPASSLVPLPPGAAEGSESDTGSGADGGRGGGFGALNAGDSQQVGGLGENAFRSQSTETHFTVRSGAASYWRTGSYDTYTGSGWRRSAPSDATASAGGEALRYRVDLARAASSPPTVWRPDRLTGPATLGLTEGHRASAGGVLPEGTTYRGVSSVPPSDPEILRASGSEYPEGIEERYTALPSGTESALRPFTNGVVGNASGPYETAVAVEEWLERTKQYSLNVSRPEGDVARAFVLRMDRGYCEYFATAMVAMVRSQGVPARYVVGYSTGQRVEEGTYRVRALNAHAWVEVYFPDVGWVRFDPTPGAARVAQERRTLQEEGAVGEYDPGASGSPDDQSGETSTSAETRTPTATPAPTSENPGDYTVSLNRSAVPGAPVTVRVSVGETPVPDAAVRVDERLVGVTGADGEVATTLPYESSVTVSATGGETVEGESLLPGDGASEETPGDDLSANRTYDVPTTATLSVSGDRRVDETVTLVATVEDVPVRNATVLLGPAAVERTDDRGRTSVELPSTPGNVTLGVERGVVTGSKTIGVDVVTVTVDPAAGLPVALAPVEVTALVNGEPEPGATVSVGGTSAGETDVDGSVKAWLPARSSVPVSVTVRGQTTATTVSNPLVNLAGLVALAVGTVVATAAALGRYGISPGDLLALAAAGSRRVVRALLEALVGLADITERAISAGRERASRVAVALRAVTAGERSLGEVVTALATWLGGVPAGVRAASPVGSGRADRRRTSDAVETTGAAEHTVREGWDRFLAHVSVDRPDVYTPGQLAAHAVAVDGLPRDAVTTLRDEFRAVEYGPRAPDAAVPGVTAAVDAIEAAADDAEWAESPGPSGTDGTDGASEASDEAGEDGPVNGGGA